MNGRRARRGSAMEGADTDPLPAMAVCPACGYPYSGPALCGWCRSVHVLTYDEMVRPASQAG